LSEEFGGATPSVILAEIARSPVGFLEEIVEARAYARAKAIWEANPTAQGELVQLAKIISFELVQEAQPPAPKRKRKRKR